MNDFARALDTCLDAPDEGEDGEECPECGAGMEWIRCSAGGCNFGYLTGDDDNNLGHDLCVRCSGKGGYYDCRECILYDVD